MEMELIHRKKEFFLLGHPGHGPLPVLDGDSIPRHQFSVSRILRREEISFLIISEQNPCLFKELPNPRNPVAEAFLRRKRLSHNSVSLFR
jgi:hypothetical protein